MPQKQSTTILPYAPTRKGKPLADLAGQKFGRLTARYPVHLIVKPHNVVAWYCDCDCGQHAYVRTSKLTTGHTQSCGCLHRDKTAEVKRTHGQCGTKTHKSWSSMIRRCKDSRNEHWKHYGARGITVCERWLKLENFYADMGDRPSHQHSLDRIDNNRGYEPGNCRWATQKEQCRNQRSNRHLTANGITKTLAEWSEITGLTSDTILRRLKRGWSEDAAILTPPYGQFVKGERPVFPLATPLS